MVPARTVGAEDALELDTLCEVLGRDRSHVLALAVSPNASTSGMPALVAERLAGSLEVDVVSLAELDPDAAMERILAERGGRADATPDEALLEVVAQLEGRGSALVLALPDAASIPAPTLARLGRLAIASGRGLRLALFVDCEAGAVDAATSRLVTGLGVGVAKIALGVPAGQGSPLPRGPETTGRPPAPPRPATAGPPRIRPAADGRKPHTPAIRVREPGRRSHSRAAGWMVLGLIAAASAAWWSGVATTLARDAEPAAPLTPVAAQLPRPAAASPALQRMPALATDAQLAAEAAPPSAATASILAEALATPMGPWPAEGTLSYERLAGSR